MGQLREPREGASRSLWALAVADGGHTKLTLLNHYHMQENFMNFVATQYSGLMK